MSGELLRGAVEAFDRHVGLGVVRSRAGAAYRFHCTQIADGSRDIAVGTGVTFGLAMAHGGVVEAVSVAPG